MFVKGNVVNTPQLGRGFYGNINQLGKATGYPGKSCLFFFTAMIPGIILSGDREQWLAKHLALRGVR